MQFFFSINFLPIEYISTSSSRIRRTAILLIVRWKCSKEESVDDNSLTTAFVCGRRRAYCSDGIADCLSKIEAA